MSKVSLEFLSWLADTVASSGRTAIGLVLEREIKDDSTVKELLLGLANTYPRFQKAVFDARSQKLSGGIGIFYNGRQLELANGLETRLKDRDALVFYPIIAGG
jgi:molybdopterin converting factor small subunit